MYGGLLKKQAEKGIQPYPTEPLQRILKRAFSKKESKNPVVLGLRAGLPVIVGRKCEPFCPLENETKTTVRFLRLFKEYGIKVVVETKCTPNIDEISELVDGVLVSVMFGEEVLHDNFEPNTPSFADRFKFAKQLKETGLWVGLCAEPVMMGINSSEQQISEYANNAFDVFPDHIVFGDYRVHNPKIAYRNFSQSGYDFLEVIRQKINWVKTAEFIFKTFREQGLKCSTTDWVNFTLKNDTEACCGDKFGFHKFTFQRALRILNEKGEVQWNDMVKNNVFGASYENKFRNIWNGKKGYYCLKDVDGIVSSHCRGDAIYCTGKKGNSKKVGAKNLWEVFSKC
ncbi:hypothetical protein KJ925_05145 [Patescibacteria group bacterium]|nr:hypothetical protein [Patescibacteria group bacterium]